MRTLNRNKQKVIIASRTSVEDDNGKPTYDTPFLFRENLSPVDSESEVKEYGERHFDMYKSTVSREKWNKKIKAEDAVYIGTSPEGEKTNGVYANYRVESVRETLNTLTVYFEKK